MPCAKPTMSARGIVRCSRSPPLKKVVETITAEPSRHRPTIQGTCCQCSTRSLRSSATTIVGIVASTTAITVLPESDAAKSAGARTPRTVSTVSVRMSRPKRMQVAMSVPRCSTIERVRGASCNPKSSSPMAMCPLLETGRNSVSPWMAPRTAALKGPIEGGTAGA